MYGVVLEHDGIVHLVNMVSGQNDDVLGVAGLNDVHVLEYGVSRAAVPVLFACALLRGQEIHHFIEFSTQETPAALQVAHQRM